LNIEQVLLLDTTGYGHTAPTMRQELWNIVLLSFLLVHSRVPLSGGFVAIVHTTAIQTQTLTRIMLAEDFSGHISVGFSLNRGGHKAKWI